MPPADSRFPAAPLGRISRLISLAAGPPYRKSFLPEREVVSLQRKILVDGRVLDQFEFGCAPRVAPDTTVSPRRPLLRVYRLPVQGGSNFPNPPAPGNAELSQETCTSPRTQDAERQDDSKALHDTAPRKGI